MKIVKVSEGKSKVKRETISKFGESIYHCDDVSEVFIKVKFKDGSSIGFERSEDDDDVEMLMGGEEE